MDQAEVDGFVRHCREEQERLRQELAPYESGSMRVRRGPMGGLMEDFTAERIEQIKREIANLDFAIQRATTELGGPR